MTGEFATCLQANMAAYGALENPRDSTGETSEAAPADAPASGGTAPIPPRDPVKAKPVKGFRLALWALWRAIVRAVRRLFGRPQT
jgi:hypothetical protein